MSLPDRHLSAVGQPPPERGRPEDAPVVVNAEAEREKAAIAADRAELRTRQAFFRTIALGAGTWSAADGVLFIVSGPERLKSQAFVWAAANIPYWPWPAAVIISVAGLLLVWAGWRALPLVGGLALLVIAAWHLAYWFMIWHAINTEAVAPLRPVSYPPLSDHAWISCASCVWGLMLLRIWWRRGRPARLDHAR